LVHAGAPRSIESAGAAIAAGLTKPEVSLNLRAALVTKRGGGHHATSGQLVESARPLALPQQRERSGCYTHATSQAREMSLAAVGACLDGLLAAAPRREVAAKCANCSEADVPLGSDLTGVGSSSSSGRPR
jgi:hypothetical protein